MNRKLSFLKNELPALLQKLNANDKGQWGALNAQQMVEHLSDAFRNYHGFDSKKILTPAEHLPKYKEFMLSDKPFRPGTKNMEMPEIPSLARLPDMQSAISELNGNIDAFINHFDKQPSGTIVNVFFGELNFDETVHLLYKHSMHHLKQFGLVQ